jgi:cytochrome c556
MQRSFLSALSALFISLVLLLGSSISAYAETTPKNAIKYRHAVMEAMAGHTGAFSMIAFGMVEHTEYLQSHANALADAGAQLKILFPEGSGEGDTHALAAIWENPEEFSVAVAEAEKATAALRDAAASGDRKTKSKAFKVLGQTCKGCHEKYREEEEHDH